MSQDLGVFIKKLFTEAESARSSREEIWMKDYLQVKSEYEQDELKKIKRSKMYVPATRVKMNTVLTQVMDFLFPASGERNWDLKPSPRPELHPSVLEFYTRQAMAQGQQLAPEDLEGLIEKKAKESCEAMGSEIADQLVGGEGRRSYRSACKSVMEQKLKYGTGILKGPLVREEFRDSYVIDGEGRWTLQKSQITELRPFFEDVSVWNAYPDPNATDLAGCEYMFQDHIYNRQQVLDLLTYPGFKEDVIRQYLRDNKDGDVDSYAGLKLQQKVSGESRRMEKRYRVYEFWGTLTGEQLSSVGIEIPEEGRADIFPANVWMLGDKVIKAVINPLEGATIPYQFDYFVKDEDSIWGDGLATLLRHPQKALNSSMRMLLDNAAVSCGPQVAANMSAFEDSEDPRDIYAFKFWPFRSVEDMNKALKFFSIPSYTNELLALVRVFNDMVDDMSVPRFMGGDGSQMRGAGKTARGLSMLIGAAHQILKDLVKSFDENITRPFFRRMYFWNMQFNTRADIKGDFEIIATGTSVLMAKEVQLERMQTILAITDNPRFAGWVDDEKLLREISKNLELPEGVLRSAREKESWDREQLMESAKANVQALVEELEGRGVDVQQGLLSMLQQQTGALMPEQGGQHEADRYAA
ncbi:portal protein [Maridesulfovibrio sp. FT414]|uniref:portal protein n=1 Tax=Maridesulfovibrio sp. FT414 TaxID=2979469 RepID=UPI003D80066A